MGTDLLGPAYMQGLKTLQDQVLPFNTTVVRYERHHGRGAVAASLTLLSTLSRKIDLIFLRDFVSTVKGHPNKSFSSNKWSRH
jgi:hypothetical protein